MVLSTYISTPATGMSEEEGKLTKFYSPKIRHSERSFPAPSPTCYDLERIYDRTRIPHAERVYPHPVVLGAGPERPRTPLGVQFAPDLHLSPLCVGDRSRWVDGAIVLEEISNIICLWEGSSEWARERVLSRIQLFGR